MSVKPTTIDSLQQSGTLEERIGARAFVWIGAIALAWAGAVLVKYSFDHELISPPIRIIMGILLGIVFLGMGEWMRSRSVRISQGFSAAGIADLYASLLAGHHLYHLIGPLPTLLLLALTTAAAALLSLRQGPLIAVLGLLGGFVTPIWIATAHPDVPLLFSYLLLLQTALVLVAGKRRWWPLALFTLVGGSTWVFGWLGSLFRHEDAIYVGAYGLLSLSCFLLPTLSRTSKARESESLAFQLNSMAGILTLIQMVALAIADKYSQADWLFLGLTAVTLLVLSRRNYVHQSLCWIASGAIAWLLAVWSSNGSPEFLSTIFLLGFVWAAGSYLMLWNSDSASRFSALSVCSSILYFLIAYAGDMDNGKTLHWSVVSIGLAALYIAAVAPVVKRRESLKDGNRIVAILAVGATAFLSLSIPLELEKEWMAVAWAVEAAAVLWISKRLHVPPLRSIALALGAMAMLRLVAPLGFHLEWNWILYAYGIPLLAFWNAAIVSRRDGRTAISTCFVSFAVVLAVFVVTLETWQFFHHGTLNAGGVFLAERSAYSICWLILGYAMLQLSTRWESGVLDFSGKALLGVALTHIIAGHLVYYNPLWMHYPVGQLRFWNQLIPLYALPAILLAIVPRSQLRSWGDSLPSLRDILVVLLSFVFFNLEVRQFFHGANLDTGSTVSLEKYMYSVTWVLFACALMVFGVMRRQLLLRYYSLGLMLAAAAKVFLYDTGHLTDVYRFLSLLGLGLSLFFVAYVYQKFLLKGARCG